MTTQPTLSTSQVMDLLNCSRVTVLKLFSKGKLRGFKAGPKTTRFYELSVRQYMDPDCPVLTGPEMIVLRHVALNDRAVPSTDDQIVVFNSLEHRGVIVTDDRVSWRLTEVGSLIFDRYIRPDEVARRFTSE